MDLYHCWSLMILLLVLILMVHSPPPTSADAEEHKEKLHIVYMGEKQYENPTLVTALHYDMLTALLGSKEAADHRLVYSYKHGFSGFAAMLTDTQAKTLAETSGVIRVSPSRDRKIQTTRSWNFLGIDLEQPSEILARSNGGKDVIIGMVDTGIWPESDSFDGAAGYDSVPSRWKGKCHSFKCTPKIIGARWYTGGIHADDLHGEYLSPRDFNGHGTQTASIAAGSLVKNVSFRGLALGNARGGAPFARIAVYKSLWGKSGTGNDATVLAAVDDAIHDGVDILSMSLDAIEDTSFGTLHAIAHGITVVFAAGNSGPMPMSVSNISPWVITVAATTMDRVFPTSFLLGNNQTFTGQSLYRGQKKDVEFENLVVGSSCDPDGLKEVDVSGKVILCPTGSTPESSVVREIASHVVKAGGKGLIVAQYAMSTLEITAPCEFIPCVLVDFEIGTRMADYIVTSTSPKVKIMRSWTDVGSHIVSPKVAGFSSRGPNTFIPGVLKPDVVAPGVNILGAIRKSFTLSSGTSMSVPHVSGIVALIKALHPKWSPAAIKSALVTTASIVDGLGSPMTAEGLPRKVADPFDYGGGQVDPSRAAYPGLIYDMDHTDYYGFVNCPAESLSLCSPTTRQGYEMNLPSIVIPNLKDSMKITRTVTNVGSVFSRYYVEVESPPNVVIDVQPRTLSFDDMMSVRSFEVSFSAVRKVQGDYGFGSLTWIDNDSHSVRIPIAVRIVLRDFYSDVS